ncbi:hypothetical protein O77CONTIG1_04371 [Leptolyngbya sp. O-77]|nr:hypothetical protein O77CONTIG1_04371 [Leptolyngbya sp. O-77]
MVKCRNPAVLEALGDCNQMMRDVTKTWALGYCCEKRMMSSMTVD